jgi:hypothetical protein
MENVFLVHVCRMSVGQATKETGSCNQGAGELACPVSRASVRSTCQSVLPCIQYKSLPGPYFFGLLIHLDFYINTIEIHSN